jgi:hypothetical protein
MEINGGVENFMRARRVVASRFFFFLTRTTRPRGKNEQQRTKIERQRVYVAFSTGPTYERS